MLTIRVDEWSIWGKPAPGLTAPDIIHLINHRRHDDRTREGVAAETTAFYILLLAMGYSFSNWPLVALYFEKKVPGKSVWSPVLARNCGYLDEICAQLGSAGFSSFGFADDFPKGEQVTWHPPSGGLRVVSLLLAHLREHPNLLEESAEVILDLERMEFRLLEAEQADSSFCFILHDSGINGMEVEQRRGFF
jgi:hypothetical protein